MTPSDGGGAGDFGGFWPLVRSQPGVPVSFIRLMKLYLSSYRIPTPDDLSSLLGKPLDKVAVALIPNAKDYYSDLAWKFKVNDFVAYMERLGLDVEIVDLRHYSDGQTLRDKLSGFDLIWAMGGNTFVLRYEMKRSGFDEIIGELLNRGKVYGGDSAGALVAGLSLAGIEAADQPEFAREVIKDGIGLVKAHILPHVDNPAFAEVGTVFRELHKADEVIELKDSQAVIFDGTARHIVTA